MAIGGSPGAPRAKEASKGAAGGYAFISEVARGYLGTLWLARDPNQTEKGPVLVRHVAPLVAASTRGAVLDSARWASALDGALPVEVIESRNAVDLATPLVDAEPLRSLLRTAALKHVAADAKVLLGIASSLLRQLDAIHQRAVREKSPYGFGGVHPDSILVGLDGRVSLFDLGVGAAASAREPWRTDPQRIGYAAPEQLETRGVVDARTDVFSTGIILWEALANRRLFPGNDAKAARERLQKATILRLDATRPSSAPGVATDVANVVARALERDRDARFETAAQCADAIAELEPASAEQIGQWVASLSETAISKRRVLLDRASLAPPPGRPSLLPTRASIPPGRLSVPPTRASIPPGRISVPPARASIPPGRVSVPPARASIPPGRISVPPTRASIPPGRLSVPPSAPVPPAARRSGAVTETPVPKPEPVAASAPAVQPAPAEASPPAEAKRVETQQADSVAQSVEADPVRASAPVTESVGAEAPRSDAGAAEAPRSDAGAAAPAKAESAPVAAEGSADAAASDLRDAAPDSDPDAVEVTDEDLDGGGRVSTARNTPPGPPPPSKRLPPLPLSSSLPPAPSQPRADDGVFGSASTELSSPVRTSQITTLTAPASARPKLPLVTTVAAFIIGIAAAGGWFLRRSHHPTASTAAHESAAPTLRQPIDVQGMLVTPTTEEPQPVAVPPTNPAAAVSEGANAPPASSAAHARDPGAAAVAPSLSAAPPTTSDTATAPAGTTSTSSAAADKAGAHRPPHPHSVPNSGYKPGGI